MLLPDACGPTTTTVSTALAEESTGPPLQLSALGRLAVSERIVSMHSSQDEGTQSCGCPDCHARKSRGRKLACCGASRGSHRSSEGYAARITGRICHRGISIEYEVPG